MSPNDVVGFRTLAAATPAAAVRIAIVDDDKDIRDLAAMILKSAGMIPIQVLPRIADIEALCGTNPDVVLVDLALGTLDAVGVMKILAAAQFRGSVVLMSGRF